MLYEQENNNNNLHIQQSFIIMLTESAKYAQINIFNPTVT